MKTKINLVVSSNNQIPSGTNLKNKGVLFNNRDLLNEWIKFRTH